MFQLVAGLAAASLFVQDGTESSEEQEVDPAAAVVEMSSTPVAAELDTRPISERGEEIEFRQRFRSWSLGDMSGRLSRRTTSSNILGLRRGQSSRVTLTVNNGAYEDNPLTITCSAREVSLGLEWIARLDRDELVYGCSFEQDGQETDAVFEMVLGGGLMGRGDRAGEYRSGDTVLRFQNREGSGGLMSSMMPDMSVYQGELEVGALDPGMMSYDVWVVREPGAVREHTTIVLAILATYTEPGN
ncbi:hypothetical protein [Maricaulis sp. MIT060901]|uniref:hypothetical protein n=1 Tax=Maricaulis sp. MIT060901 TaxID=3096993 RepID=UPI003999EEE2